MYGKNTVSFNDYNDVSKYYNALGRLDSSINEDPKDRKLYHYTSARVLNAILLKGCFWASNIFYLNDKIEYKMGIDILNKVFEHDDLVRQYINEISDVSGKDLGIYSISFSNKQDELQQWITYARESGVCIELNSKIVWGRGNNRLYLGIKSNEHSYCYYKSTCFLKLAYEKGNLSTKEKQPQLDADIIKNSFAKAIIEIGEEDTNTVLDEAQICKKWESNPEHAKNFLKLLSAYYKEERFKGEGEIRAAFLPAQTNLKSKNAIEYFEQANGILRPYMQVFFVHNYEDGGEFQIECPIRSITIGPGGSQQSVFDSVVHRLEYTEAKVWNYELKELEELLGEFVFGCIEQYKAEIKDEMYQYVVRIIIEDWCKRTNYKYELIESSKIQVAVELKESNKEDNLASMSICNQTDDYLQARLVSEKYMKSNFFTRNGIWIKKSSVSYIF